jgi:hypothetical protein
MGMENGEMQSGRERENKEGKYLERRCIKGKKEEVEERRGVERMERRSKDVLYICMETG